MWSGELDTLAPRVAITRTVADGRYHYETVAEDYNLVRDGFSSPCGAGVGEGESFSAWWYQTLFGSAPGAERLYRLTATCDTPATGLFQTGVWDGQPWITGQPAVVSGTDETTAYVPAGRLWQVDVSDPARPRLADIYPAVENAQSVALDETHAYVAEGARGLSVLPLDDPSAPAARYDTPGEAADAALTGDHVIVANGNGGLRVLDVSDPAHPVEVGHYATGELQPTLFGIGGEPTWAPDDRALAFVFRREKVSYLVAANMQGWGLTQEGYSTTDWMGSPAWTDHTLPQEITEPLVARMQEEEPPLYTELLVAEANPHYRLVGLPNVNGGDGREKLSDAVNDSFNALRRRVEAETGWDYLAILGDSYRVMNHTPRPGQGRISWHVCGRAIDINQGYLRDGRIELVREDVGGVTYWRVYIRAKEQDGTLGEPLRVLPWDLSARNAGGLAAAQGGEPKGEVPEGYYVDFTRLAADYGWERRNALSNWRNSWFDIEWWHFQKTEGLSWYDCMVEIYDVEEIAESYGDLPWWTRRPETEVQKLPW